MKFAILRENRSTTFDITILGILGLILLAIAIVIIRGDRVGEQVTATIPDSGQSISALGKVGLTFKHAMNTKEIEERIKIEPATPGSFTWEGNTVWFIPRQAWQPSVNYRLLLQAGASSLDGREVLQDHTVTFRARPPGILYLSTQGSSLALWSRTVDGGSPRQLSAHGEDVYDFSASRDGEQVAYSVTNADGGQDLRMIDRDGTHNHLLAACAMDRCFQPVWSPDGKHLVYYRQVAQEGNVSTTGIWTVDPATGQTQFIFPGTDPSFSPDGNQLVTVDRQAGVIRVLNIQTGKGIELQAAGEILPAWYPDSSKLIYANLQAAGALTNVALFQIEISGQHVSRLLDSTPSDVELAMPGISPDGSKILIGMRVFGGVSTEQLYVMGLDGSHAHKITDDPLYNNASYSWDPWGTRIVYQRLQSGVSAPSPQVMVWDSQTGKSVMIAEHASLPEWLP